MHRRDAGRRISTRRPSGRSRTPPFSSARSSAFSKARSGTSWDTLRSSTTPGRFKTVTLGRTPLILVHGPDGNIRAFHNACAHRGTMVEDPFQGTRGRIRVPLSPVAVRPRRTARAKPRRKGLPGFLRPLPPRARGGTGHDLRGSHLREPARTTAGSRRVARLHPGRASRRNGRRRAPPASRLPEGGVFRQLEGLPSTTRDITRRCSTGLSRSSGGGVARVARRAIRTGTESPGPGLEPVPTRGLLRDPELIAYRGGNAPRNKFPGPGTPVPCS